MLDLCVDADTPQPHAELARACVAVPRPSPSDSVSSVCLWSGVCAVVCAHALICARRTGAETSCRLEGVSRLWTLSKTTGTVLCNGAGMDYGPISASFASSASSEREHSAELRAPCEMGATRHVSLTRGRQQTARECQSAGPPRAPPLAPRDNSQGTGPRTH